MPHLTSIISTSRGKPPLLAVAFLQLAVGWAARIFPETRLLWVRWEDLVQRLLE